MSESGTRKTQENNDSHRKALPKEVRIPDDFKGVVQINVQSQKEKETETETETTTQSQTQNTAVAVAVRQLQSQMQAVSVQIQQVLDLMQPITVQIQQTQAQQQACCTQTAAQLQGLQAQLQMLFMAVLGMPAGADAGERQSLLRDIVQSLRASPQ